MRTLKRRIWPVAVALLVMLAAGSGYEWHCSGEATAR